MANLPTAEQVTNLYLYGKTIQPMDKTADVLIRPENFSLPPISIDVNDYMAGPGRFANASNFKIIEYFFNPSLYPQFAALTPGKTYTKADLYAIYNIANLPDKILNIDQAMYDDGQDDFLERAYIWNTTAFQIDDRASFTISATGVRSIEKFGLEPYDNQGSFENFDFNAGSVFGNIVNSVLEDKIDPSRIGRKVEFRFDLSKRTVNTFTYADYINSRTSYIPTNPTLYAYIAANSAAFLDRLWQSGATRTLDSDGRAILYGTEKADSNLSQFRFDYSVIDPLDSNMRTAINQKGVRLIGGRGNDRLYGANLGDYLVGGSDNDFLSGGTGDDKLEGGAGDDKLQGGGDHDTLDGGAGNDTLDGGADKDQLFGGRGFDTYVVDSQDTITDGDGKGEVRLNGRVLKGGKRKCKDPKNTYRGDKGEIYVLIGTTLMVDGGLIIKNYKKGDLGIQLKDEEDNPIQRIKKKTKCAEDIPSPIMLDLDGDGVGTAELEGGAYFDHAADGFAEMTAWVGSGDGLLVRDINGNGSIDSGRELFGSETQLANGSKAANGFEALRELDTNSDGVIDANDAAFAELRVWKDSDGNGRTDTGELFTFEDVGVRSINVAFSESSLVDEQGNEHRQVGSYTTTDGQTRAATDVWVQTNTLYRVPTESVAVPTDVGALPDVQAYGKVRDLRQAMAMDATGELKAMVTAFTQAATPEDRDALVTQIIYRWAGVQDVNPTSRAPRMIYGNARKLEALEEFMGEEWVGVWCWGTRDPNPHGRAAPVLLAAWDELKERVYAELMSQSQLKTQFDKINYRDNVNSNRTNGLTTYRCGTAPKSIASRAHSTFARARKGYQKKTEANCTAKRIYQAMEMG